MMQRCIFRISNLSSVKRRYLSSSDIEKQFRNAVAAMKSTSSNSQNTVVTDDLKLKVYALYKQVEVGPCDNKHPPSVFDFAGRAKYTAWSSLQNMSKEDAMKTYIEIVKPLFGNQIPSVIVDEKPVGNISPPTTVSSNTTASRSLSDIIFPTSKSDKADLSDAYQAINCKTDESGILRVTLNRPQRGNALNMTMLNEILQVFAAVKASTATRVVVLSGSSCFSTGMDLSVFAELQQLLTRESCPGRQREATMRLIEFLQEVVDAAELCSVPVIAAIHGSCIGGALDLVTACDLRYCTQDAVFCVKEIDLAIVADMGGLQRLPALVGDQAARELAYTGRLVTGREAAQLGLVLRCFESREEMAAHVEQVAGLIASKSPLTLRGVKQALLYSRDHGLRDSLQQVKLWNGAVLQSRDLAEAFEAALQRRPPVFRE
mmetsp:Transcript_1698/g.2702  ORF Transcript_1698/g.2702 Transcript_1698/m.2702 type:complete len:432 (+) Transcript_1698:1243-2538(+)